MCSFGLTRGGWSAACTGVNVISSRASGVRRPDVPRASRRGVTRFELLLTVGATALVVSLGAWLNLGHATVDHESDARTRGKALLNAAEQWKREQSGPGCPSITQLKQESRLDATARAEDPWGERFRIRCTERELEVWSAGRDRRFDTSDDITLGSKPTS